MNQLDIELLSAYLDGQLNSSESALLESRISTDESLRTALDDLRATRRLLRQLPSRRVPRNFTLTPKMTGIKPPMPRTVPVFRFATAITTFLFLITFIINGLISLSAPSFAAARPPSAIGAAPMSAAQEAVPAAAQPPVPLPTNAATETSAPRLMSAPPLMTPTLMPLGASVSSAATETPTPQFALKSNTLQADHAKTANVQQNELSLPLGLEILFGILAIGFGLTTWITSRYNESNIRKRWKKK
jgi:anti-sigma factor RsiW